MGGLRRIVVDFRDVAAEHQLLQTAPPLPFSKVTSVKQYPLPLGAKEGIKPVMQEMREQGVVINTHSPFTSPVWPVKKPNGKWRLTVDFRRLNANTGPLTAAVPNMAELVYNNSGESSSDHGNHRC